MYRQKVIELLSNNGIDENAFFEKMHRTLLLGVFEVICKEIKKQATKASEKERFRQHKDKTVATKRIVSKYVGCHLSDDEYAQLTTLLTAFFRTGDPRKKYDENFREQLLKQQNGRCKICRKRITTDSAHLDHVVPWDYVGDNLGNNYQMLCETCNERKGTAAYFEISMLLLNREQQAV